MPVGFKVRLPDRAVGVFMRYKYAGRHRIQVVTGDAVVGPLALIAKLKEPALVLALDGEIHIVDPWSVAPFRAHVNGPPRAEVIDAGNLRSAGKAGLCVVAGGAVGVHVPLERGSQTVGADLGERAAAVTVRASAIAIAFTLINEAEGAANDGIVGCLPGEAQAGSDVT